MKKYVKNRLLLSILIAAMLVVAMDIIVMRILQEFYLKSSPETVLLYDFSVVLLAGLAGLFFASRVDCPFWWRQSDGSTEQLKRTYIPVVLGVSIVVLNALNNLININQAAQIAPWLALLSPEMALAISLRAALNEEIFFRFFLFPLVALGIRQFINSRQTSLVIGALGSTLVFAFIHPGFIWAFLTGLAMTYIYYHRGLLPAMTVHFLADAIPFLLISIML